MALVPRSLVVHVSSSDYSRLVQEQGGPGLSHCWPCPPTPPWAHLRGCQSTPAACYCPPLQGRCAWAGPLGGLGGCERAKLEEEARLLLENLAATEMLRSRSSLATAEAVTIGVSLPTFRPKGDQNRPPWRYWRRSTPEPQHRKPGEELDPLSLNHVLLKEPSAHHNSLRVDQPFRNPHGSVLSGLQINQ